MKKRGLKKMWRVEQVICLVMVMILVFLPISVHA